MSFTLSNGATKAVLMEAAQGSTSSINLSILVPCVVAGVGLAILSGFAIALYISYRTRRNRSTSSSEIEDMERMISHPMPVKNPDVTACHSHFRKGDGFRIASVPRLSPIRPESIFTSTVGRGGRIESASQRRISDKSRNPLRRNPYLPIFDSFANKRNVLAKRQSPGSQSSFELRQVPLAYPGPTSFPSVEPTLQQFHFGCASISNRTNQNNPFFTQRSSSEDNSSIATQASTTPTSLTPTTPALLPIQSTAHLCSASTSQGLRASITSNMSAMLQSPLSTSPPKPPPKALSAAVESPQLCESPPQPPAERFEIASKGSDNLSLSSESLTTEPWLTPRTTAYTIRDDVLETDLAPIVETTRKFPIRKDSLSLLLFIKRAAMSGSFENKDEDRARGP